MLAPSIELGHSVGEIAAACVAGAMAIELTVARVRLVHQLSCKNGTMAAARCITGEVTATTASCLSEDEKNPVRMASMNCPNSITASDVHDVVEKVLLSMGKEYVHLQISLDERDGGRVQECG